MQVRQDQALPVDYRADVIIAAYRGLAETRGCIESILQTRRLNRAFGQLVLIDDCSPEPLLRSYLEDVAGRTNDVVLLTHAANLGFVASINRGISVAGNRDVVLLNSDCEVCGNWLDRLALQAYADPKIATVTPFSNNATICSYPEIRGQPELPPGTSLAQIDLACMKANPGRAVDLPTGVGSCMLVKRACLTEIGAFDEETFGMGYGEEVDFCQRALKRGWRHVLAGDVFVLHTGGVSFGASKPERLAQAGATLQQLHPNFHLQVERWIKDDPAGPLRQGIAAALAWSKVDTIHALAAPDAASRYLEICTPTTGNQYAEIDRSRFAVCHRLMSRCPDGYDDGFKIDFRSADNSIGGCVAEIARAGLSYDIILVDPWHEYGTSVAALEAALELLADGGTIVVHDCLPAAADEATPQYRPGAWCGVTFKAYVDFIAARPGLIYCTVDADYGCGLIRKLNWRDRLPALAKTAFHQLKPRPTPRIELFRKWRALGDNYAAAYRFLVANRVPLLNLCTADAFRAGQAQWVTAAGVSYPQPRPAGDN
jgi:GT2 family glycosyltransferase